MTLKSISHNKQHLILLGFIIVGLIINFIGITNPFFTDDPGLYALISKNICLSNDWASLTVHGQDWLDKPHFQFWITALSFKVFGINTFAYKLPSFLFFCLGCYYTYKIGEITLSKTAGLLGVTILLSTLHIGLSNEDIRAETLMIGLIVPSMYYIIRLTDDLTTKDLLLASLFTACSIMTKGIVAGIPAVAGLLIYYIAERRTKEIWSLKWFLWGMYTFVFLVPEFIALHIQFLKQPDISPIQWFLWDSQFGRFMGEGTITRPKSNILEYFGNFIWASIPWIFMLVLSLIFYLKEYKNHSLKMIKLLIPIGGALFMSLIFSLSSFQLPHYNNIIFPFLSLIIAWFFIQKKHKEILNTQWFVISILLMGIVVLGYYTKSYYISGAMFLIGNAVLTLLIIDGKALVSRVVLGSAFTSYLLLLTIALIYYPTKLKYAQESTIGTYINENYPHKELRIFDLQKINNSFYFNYNGSYSISKIDSLEFENKTLALTQSYTIKYLLWQDIKVDTIEKWKIENNENFSLNIFDENKITAFQELVLLELNHKKK